MNSMLILNTRGVNTRCMHQFVCLYFVMFDKKQDAFDVNRNTASVQIKEGPTSSFDEQTLSPNNSRKIMNERLMYCKCAERTNGW